jgi:hypothetical protein
MEREQTMSVTLTTHPSFKEYLIAECDAPCEKQARRLVEATARRAQCDILHESHARPRPYAKVHVWFLAPRAPVTHHGWQAAHTA